MSEWGILVDAECDWQVEGALEKLLWSSKSRLQICSDLAPFSVDRLEDTNVNLCAKHLAEYLRLYGVQKVRANEEDWSYKEVVPAWKSKPSGLRAIINHPLMQS